MRYVFSLVLLCDIVFDTFISVCYVVGLASRRVVLHSPRPHWATREISGVSELSPRPSLPLTSSYAPAVTPGLWGVCFTLFLQLRPCLAVFAPEFRLWDFVSLYTFRVA